MKPETNLDLIRKFLLGEAESIEPAYGVATIDTEIDGMDGDAIQVEGVLYGEFETVPANYIDGEMEYGEHQTLTGWYFEGKAYILDEDEKVSREFTEAEINE
jgi:hypothetical protein